MKTKNTIGFETRRAKQKRSSELSVINPLKLLFKGHQHNYEILGRLSNDVTDMTIQSGTNFSNINIDSLSYGLYLLKVTDRLSVVGYKCFLVGEYCASTAVQFRNNSGASNSILFN